MSRITATMNMGSTIAASTMYPPFLDFLTCTPPEHPSILLGIADFFTVQRHGAVKASAVGFKEEITIVEKPHVNLNQIHHSQKPF